MTTPTVLITGAAGRTSGYVIKALLDSKAAVNRVTLIGHQVCRHRRPRHRGIEMPDGNERLFLSVSEMEQ